MQTKTFIKFGLSTITVLAMVAVSSGSVFAITQATGSAATTRQEQRMTNLKTRADNEIDRRVTSLDSLISRINAMTKLSASDRAMFTSQIQTEITNLTNLKTKIDADTDPATLQADVKSIIQSYRVYVVFMPQVSILAAADRMNEAADMMATLSGKLQSRITTAQQNGQNVVSLQAALTDLNSKVADAKTQDANATSTVLPLTPGGYPGNVVQLKAARADLQTGRQDLVAALKDAQTIIQGLKVLGTGKAATGSATATSSAH